MEGENAAAKKQRQDDAPRCVTATSDHDDDVRSDRRRRIAAPRGAPPHGREAPAWPAL
jgi:maltooligosyltrehalose synthase